MSDKRVNSFFTYRLLESKRKYGLSLNEDETGDLSSDIDKADFSKDEDKGEKKEENPESKNYKVNMSLDLSDKSNESSYGSYMALFIEALNSLDSIDFAAKSVDPDAEAVKNYKNDRYDIATAVDKNAKGLSKAWDKIASIAGSWPPSGKGLTSVVQSVVKNDNVYKDYFKEKKVLDDQLNGTPKLKQEVYDEELKKLKDKYSAMIDPKQIMVLSKVNEAVGYYRKAIDIFRKGADVELGFIEKREGGISGEDLNKVNELRKIIYSGEASNQEKVKAVEKLQKDFPAFFGQFDKQEIMQGGIDQILDALKKAPEDFYEKVSDTISNVVLSKDPNTNKSESYSYSENSEYILEDLGGTLNQAKLFASGVGKGIADGFKGGAKDTPAESGDKASLIYAADGLKGNLMSLASEIDNVINFKKNLYGLSDKKEAETATEKGAKITADEAKAEAEEIISFVRESFTYVTGVRKEIEKGSTLSSIKEKLEAIGKKIQQIVRKGGILDKWKDDVLGTQRERVATTGYLEKGRSLMQMASAKLSEVSNQLKIEKRISDRDADKVLKTVMDKAADLLSGNLKDEKPSLIKRKSDVKVFSRDSAGDDPETVKTFQQRLMDLGHLPTGTPNGEFDDATKAAAKIAMNYIGDLTGKVYADTDEAFSDFQRDLGFYRDNKEEIRKNLGF